MNDLLQTITEKKARLDSFHPLPPELITNLEEWFKAINHSLDIYLEAVAPK